MNLSLWSHQLQEFLGDLYDIFHDGMMILRQWPGAICAGLVLQEVISFIVTLMRIFRF